MKKDVKTVSGALDMIERSRGVYYFWNEKSKHDMTRKHIGVIAQEVEKVIPEAVVKDDEGYLSVNMTGYIPVLIEAVKDLKHMVKDLVAKVAALFDTTTQLKAENEALKERVSTLEERLDRLESAPKN